jgi:hypothetical protein
VIIPRGTGRRSLRQQPFVRVQGGPVFVGAETAEDSVLCLGGITDQAQSLRSMAGQHYLIEVLLAAVFELNSRAVQPIAYGTDRSAGDDAVTIRRGERIDVSGTAALDHVPLGMPIDREHAVIEKEPQ